MGNVKIDTKETESTRWDEIEMWGWGKAPGWAEAVSSLAGMEKATDQGFKSLLKVWEGMSDEDFEKHFENIFKKRFSERARFKVKTVDGKRRLDLTAPWFTVYTSENEGGVDAAISGRIEQNTEEKPAWQLEFFTYTGQTERNVIRVYLEGTDISPEAVRTLSAALGVLGCGMTPTLREHLWERTVGHREALLTKIQQDLEASREMWASL